MRVRWKKRPRCLSRIIAIGLIAVGCQGPAPIPPLVVVGTKQQIGEAMISVQAHALWPDRDFSGATFLTLEQAVDILRVDTGPLAASRTRRAVAKLWSHGYGRPDFRNAVKLLLAPYGIGIVAFEGDIQDAAASAVPPIPLPPVTAMLPQFEALISNQLVALTRECPYKPPTWTGLGVDTMPPPVDWAFNQLIPRRMEDIARSLDPQSWDKTSTLFYASYLVDSPSCCPTNGLGTCTFTAVSPTNHDPLSGTPEPVAKPYGYTPFFESFCVGTSCPQCEGSPICVGGFKNILCVKSEYDGSVPFSFLASTANSYTVHFRLGRFLFGEIDGTENQYVDDDRGQLSVRPATSAEKVGLSGTDWSMVHVEKTLSFKSSSMATALAKSLLARENEIAGQIVEQACLNVPAECWVAP